MQEKEQSEQSTSYYSIKSQRRKGCSSYAYKMKISKQMIVGIKRQAKVAEINAQ